MNNFFTFVVLNLRCFECISGECQNSSTFFGIETTCKGNDPICIKQIHKDGHVTRGCQYSYNYELPTHPNPKKQFIGECKKYGGKETCYCLTHNCNSSLTCEPIVVLVILTFVIPIVYKPV